MEERAPGPSRDGFMMYNSPRKCTWFQRANCQPRGSCSADGVGVGEKGEVLICRFKRVLVHFRPFLCQTHPDLPRSYTFLTERNGIPFSSVLMRRKQASLPLIGLIR